MMGGAPEVTKGPCDERAAFTGRNILDTTEILGDKSTLKSRCIFLLLFFFGVFFLKIT